jgi:murein DD-endopeptidase MepM/ murein hydrolase activator NlpD
MTAENPEGPMYDHGRLDKLVWLLFPLALGLPLLLVLLALVLGGWRPALLAQVSTRVPLASAAAIQTGLPRGIGPAITASPTATSQIGLTPAQPAPTPGPATPGQPAAVTLPLSTAAPGPPIRTGDPLRSPTRQAESTAYIVQLGDTLRKAAARLGVPVQSLVEGNEIVLAPGQTLRVPPTSTAVPSHLAAVSVSPTVAALRYVFPVQPPSVASFQAGHHDYPATDIFAPAGSAIVAVTSGVIQEVSREDNWDSRVDDGATRGGLFVSLIGDDGVRYYGSHLSAVVPWLEPGLRVAAGELLGYVGNTGNARGVAPHLHFGISRPTFAGDWQVRRGEVWPFEYLQAWERGEMITPRLPVR